jgi:competence protein ComEC
MTKRLFLSLFLAGASLLSAAADLQVYAIDVEGGKSTLFVSPTGQSMLVDTGYNGFRNRDADRILAAAKAAGVKQIDYLVITHYHHDHVGGVPELAAKIPIRNFVDLGRTSRRPRTTPRSTMRTSRSATRPSILRSRLETESPSKVCRWRS